MNDLTRSERWALYVATHASGTLGALVLLAIAVVFAALAAFRSASVAWALVPTFLLLALMYWERSGFRRLLQRHEAELATARGGDGRSA